MTKQRRLPQAKTGPGKSNHVTKTKENNSPNNPPGTKATTWEAEAATPAELASLVSCLSYEGLRAPLRKIKQRLANKGWHTRS